MLPPIRLRIATQIMGEIIAAEGPGFDAKACAERALSAADALITAAGYDPSAEAEVLAQVGGIIRQVIDQQTNTAPPVFVADPTAQQIQPSDAAPKPRRKSRA